MDGLLLSYLQLQEYQDSGKLWADSLTIRLHELHIMPDDLKSDMSQAYSVADLLLQDPYKRMLDSLEKIANAQNEDLED